MGKRGGRGEREVFRQNLQELVHGLCSASLYLMLLDLASLFVVVIGLFVCLSLLRQGLMKPGEL